MRLCTIPPTYAYVYTRSYTEIFQVPLMLLRLPSSLITDDLSPSLFFSLCSKNFFLFHFHYLLLNISSLPPDPGQQGLSVLPSPDAIRLGRYGIHPKALADLPAGDIAIL